MNDSLDHLVAGVVSRQEAAFAALYEIAADHLAAFAYSMLGDRSAAEDVVQQSFLELARSAGDFEGDGRALKAWLYKATRFGCLDELRRRKRRPEDPIESPPERPGVAVDEPDYLELDLALDSLSLRQKTLLYLKHVEGMSGSEVAEVLDINRPAAFAAISRAEAALRKAYEVNVESDVPAASLRLEGGHQ